jgi:DNA-binding MarR family transcriptional regulator
MSENTNELKEISRRLGVVITLLLKLNQGGGEGMSQRSIIVELQKLGMGPTEIANILGRTPSYVTKELATLKRQKGKVADGQK